MAAHFERLRRIDGTIASVAKRGSKTSRKSVTLDASMRIVVLKGREQFQRLRYTQDLREMLEEQFGGVEVFEFDGRTVDLATVLDELRSYGLMQQHKLVILDHADAFITPGGSGDGDSDDDKDEDDAGSGKRASRRPAMEAYAENPVPDATLLLRAETWRPGNLDKKIRKAGGAILDCKEVDAPMAVKWCINRCVKQHEAEIDRPTASMLVERLGPQLDRLDQELKKLATFVGPGGQITQRTVMEMTGLSRDEAGWMIQEAVLTGNPGYAASKLGELLDVSRVAYEPLAWSLMDLTRKMHAASAMLKQGMPPGVINKELRLWGRSGDLLTRAARGTAPPTCARLFEQAVRGDQYVKSGRGDIRRSLEATTILLADTMIAD